MVQQIPSLPLNYSQPPELFSAPLVEGLGMNVGEMHSNVALNLAFIIQIRASAAGKRESTPRPRETTPPKNEKDQLEVAPKKAPKPAQKKVPVGTKEAAR